jgi:surfeit locus 1 family protein
VPGLFTPKNDIEQTLWYWPDVAGLTASAFSGAGVQTLPFTVDADAKPAPPGGLPAGGVTRLDLPNRHLEYALTWYGLALTLIGVYAAFAVSRLRPAR